MLRKVMSIAIFGLPVIPTFVGSFLLMSTMFMWYGGFFVHRFHPLMGIVEDDVTAEALGLWYPMGFFFMLVQGIGIATLLKWRQWPGLLTSAITGTTAAILLGATVFSFRLVILPEHSIELFLINSSGLLVAWTLGATTITLLRPR